jgi:hypothetical protein
MKTYLKSSCSNPVINSKGIKNISLLIFLVLFTTACEKNNSKETKPVEDAPAQIYTGVVIDYTGLDGCSYIVELDNGEKLDPVSLIDSTFQFIDGRRVALRYTVLTEQASNCMVGKMVSLDWIAYINCTDIIKDSIISIFPDDPLIINSAEVNHDCLDISLSYGGGCAEHVIQLVWLISPTLGDPELRLFHESNNDPCEAYITELISFDLIPLQVADASSVTFTLTANTGADSNYNQTFIYSY